MPDSAEPGFNPGRRKFITALTLGGAAVVAAKTPLGRDTIHRAADALSDLANPEKRPPSPTEYGFTSHVLVNPKPGENMTVDMFKRSADLLAANGQSLIRFNIRDWEAVSEGNANTIVWNEEHMRRYDEVVQYAVDKGLKINLVLNTPKFAEGFNIEDYKRTTQQYFSTLATRYQGKIDTYQLFNEADYHSFRDYAGMEQLTPTYLEELRQVVKVASDAIKSVDPTAKTAMNFTTYPHSVETAGADFFDTVSPYVDVLALDLYPDNNLNAIDELPDRIDFVTNRYPGHRVIVGEIGMSTGDGRFTAEDQAHYLPLALQSLQRAKHRPEAVLIYSLTDEVNPNATESGFGLLDMAGKPKSSFNVVLSHMPKPQPTQTPQPQ